MSAMVNSRGILENGNSLRCGGNSVNDRCVYEPPKVLTMDNETLTATLGPSLSCTGFGGSAGNGC